ncbi:MAG: hypothetical protein AB1508_11570 [Pseudomonadota bacterium]
MKTTMAKRSRPTKIVESLAIPDWIPPSVADLVNQLQKELPKQKDLKLSREILERLASAPSMQLVWRELFRLKRAEDDAGSLIYFHPAFTARPLHIEMDQLRGRKGKKATEQLQYVRASIYAKEVFHPPREKARWPDQDAAARILMYQAYKLSFECEPLYKKDRLDRRRALRQCCETLFEIEECLELHGLEEQAVAASKLQSAIRWASRLSASKEGNSFWGEFERAQADDRQKVFCLLLKDVTIEFFGYPLYGTIANIAKAVFDRQDITGRQVREWLRNDPTKQQD